MNKLLRVGHLINTYDWSQKNKPGGSLRVFVGDRSIGDGNVSCSADIFFLSFSRFAKLTFDIQMVQLKK